MQTPEPFGTQTQRFIEELKRLNLDVTESDRKVAMETLGIRSHATISQYLNGKGRNNDTAANLITVFKECIAKRNQVLA